ncbi:MAG: hypothetical protein RML36_12445 [Anaerolineae bacterium]|nr:hypothetical protein [Anaerolineae bacterium]MDW8100281.1 hypothetical protein [Anaerolineae bacterium]
MASQELLILVGHAWQCPDCRRLLLDAPERVLSGRPLNASERERLTQLRAEHFASVSALAQALEVRVSDLYEVMNHARARLRHF